MNTTLKRILSTMALVGAPLVGAMEPDADSTLQAPSGLVEAPAVVDSGADTTGAAADTASPPPGLRDTAVVGPLVASVAAMPARSPWMQRLGTDWTVLVDFADIDGGGRWNRRHLRMDDSLANLCCLDLAWSPWHPVAGVRVGPSLDLGRLRRELSDGTVVTLTDLLVAASLGWASTGSGPWVRGDLGVSTLFVARRSIGTDWGLGGSIRAGWRYDPGGWAVVAGCGRDVRAYANLDVKDVPAITLFAGVEW